MNTNIYEHKILDDVDENHNQHNRNTQQVKMPTFIHMLNDIQSIPDIYSSFSSAGGNHSNISDKLMSMECCWNYTGAGQPNTHKKPVPVRLPSPQIMHRLTQDRTWATTVTGW